MKLLQFSLFNRLITSIKSVDYKIDRQFERASRVK